MKHMKRRRSFIAYLLVVSLLFCNFASMSAFATDDISNERQIIDSFFKKEYTIWDDNGQDITSYFYSSMSPYYRVRDYDTIGNFMLEHVAKAISAPFTTTGDSRSTLRIISQQRSFYERVTDEIHDWEEWNAFYGDVELVYHVDTLTNRIVSADEPIIILWDIQRMHGDGDCELELSNPRGTVNSAGNRATFSFHLCAEFYNVSSIIPDYGEFNDTGLSFRYNADIVFTETSLY